MSQLTAGKPTILVINFTNPWVIDEVYNSTTDQIKTVLATFGITHEAIMDVLTGNSAPTGKMPFSTPVSEEAVLNQQPDLPGYMENFHYSLFKFDEGLTY